MKNPFILVASACCCVIMAYRIPHLSASHVPVAKDSTVIGVKTIISGLDVPWQIIWGPDDQIWMTEQKGMVSKVDPTTGKRIRLLKVPDVFSKKSYGLLGMALSPDFKQHPYVYIDYTYLKPQALKDTTLRDSSIVSKLVRYTFKNDTLINPLVLLHDIPGNTYHNGCRVIFAPDGKILMTTGDAGQKNKAQNPLYLNGKVLRINPDGTIPADNPIPGSPVWSWGHRNAEGLVFSENGTLYNSENGDANDDEINIITKGNNYGWPQVEGFCDRPTEKEYCKLHKITEPIKAWTPTIAPSGMEYYKYDYIPEWKNSLLLGTLKGNSLRVLKLSNNGKTIIRETVYFEMQLGRIRSLCVAPNGQVYLSTSNRDWNPSPGFPKPGDDRIVQLYKVKTVPEAMLAGKSGIKNTSLVKPQAVAGDKLFLNYCASCHKPDGNGITGTFPPLRGNKIVNGPKSKLLAVLLRGLKGPITVKGIKYNQEMPSFAFMKNEELRAIVNYVRTSLGNKASTVSINDIKESRR